LAITPLAEIQDRLADRLRLNSIRMARSQAGTKLRLAAIVIAIGLATLLNVSALLYALRHGHWHSNG